MGPHEGRKTFTLQTVPADERPTKPFLATHAGFSLHAGVAVRGGGEGDPEGIACSELNEELLGQKKKGLRMQALPGVSTPKSYA